jgi:hypothetical protein
MSKFGRYQAVDPPSALRSLHWHDGTTQLKEIDHEPNVAVLDQEDLLAQGIHVSQFIPGAKDVDALGSCTANATVGHTSTVLSEQAWLAFTGASSYTDTVGAEKGAITFYHRTTDQTGDPSQEWPPTDCGSSGPFIYSELVRLGLAKGQRIAHGADNIVSVLQLGSVLIGQPFLNAWMDPGVDGMIDGNGSAATIESQIQQGVAGGHETVISAVEKLVLLPTGLVDPTKTIIRLRNSWDASWGDSGSYRAHLSTFAVYLGSQCDFRQIIAA